MRSSSSRSSCPWRAARGAPIALLMRSSSACRAATAAAALASRSAMTRFISSFIARSCSCSRALRCSFSARVVSRYSRKAVHLCSRSFLRAAASSAFFRWSRSIVCTTMSYSRLFSSSSRRFRRSRDSCEACAERRSSSRCSACRWRSAAWTCKKASWSASTLTRSCSSSSCSLSIAERRSAIWASSMERTVACFWRNAARLASSSCVCWLTPKSVSRS
mmetsp:Transcript_58470/g.161808  ORF Transcript_58470/g.161808 Transcript_58470/m.161808 type:complete len:219 (+) Transcript_58470:548-1204(+)